ncbi:MAG TPA: phosphopantetheine-binding protein, partial [Herpetosiphonaceae bacterium]
EPGEIAAALRRHPAVRDAAVLLREDPPQTGAQPDQRLVAYVVREQGAGNLELGTWNLELRTYLKDRLPDYMVPSAFVVLDALPLTANGKLDRRALPEPEGQRPAAIEYVAPQTDIERAVAQVWQDVLGLDKVGLYDNFFDLGGHSLLMVQIHSKLRNALGTDISMVDLFTYPTVSTIAQHLSQTRVESSPFQSTSEEIHTRSDARRQRRQLRQAGRTAESQESDEYE